MTTTLAQESSWREQFDRDGYLALEGYFSTDRIDAVRAAIGRLLERAAGEIVVDNMLNGKRTFWSHATNRETRHFKFNDLYLLSEDVRQLVLDKDLARLLNSLLGRPVVLCNSLNFEKGSSQPKHIDSLFMTPQTPHSLIATWIAMEDAHPGIRDRSRITPVVTESLCSSLPTDRITRVEQKWRRGPRTSKLR